MHVYITSLGIFIGRKSVLNIFLFSIILIILIVKSIFLYTNRNPSYLTPEIERLSYG